MNTPETANRNPPETVNSETAYRNPPETVNPETANRNPPRRPPSPSGASSPAPPSGTH